MFGSGELVKTHRRVSRGRKSTDWNDYPPEEVAFLQRTPAWCRQRARDVAGEHVSRLVTELLAGNALHILLPGHISMGHDHRRARRPHLAAGGLRACADSSHGQVDNFLEDLVVGRLPYQEDAHNQHADKGLEHQPVIDIAA